MNDVELLQLHGNTCNYLTAQKLCSDSLKNVIKKMYPQIVYI